MRVTHAEAIQRAQTLRDARQAVQRTLDEHGAGIPVTGGDVKTFDDQVRAADWPAAQPECVGALLEQYQAAVWALAMAGEPLFAARWLTKHARHPQFQDLVGEVWVQLYTAAERWDPDRGLQFSTYARTRTMFAVNLWHEKTYPARPVPHAMQKSAMKMAGLVWEATGSTWDALTTEEIQDVTGLSLESVETRLLILAFPVELDHPDVNAGALGRFHAPQEPIAPPGAARDEQRRLRRALRQQFTCAELMELTESVAQRRSGNFGVWPGRVRAALEASGVGEVDPGVLWKLVEEMSAVAARGSGARQRKLFAGAN